MAEHGGQVPDGTPAVPERSGSAVEEAVDRAAHDAQGGATLRPPDQAEPGTAPVEQVDGDADMTGGQRVGDGSGDDVAGQQVPPAEAAVSGGAQSDPGARTPDRAAATDDEG